jgi:hypothetical protein
MSYNGSKQLNIVKLNKKLNNIKENVVVFLFL